jgi:hypothetical protein
MNKVPTRRLCARHNSLRKDARLVSFFLCNGCFIELKSKAFNNKDPEFPRNNHILEGYCSNCNKLTKVKQYFWYLCEICTRIIRSYGKEKAAREFILNQWEELRIKHNTDITLEVIDEVRIMTYNEHLKYKKYIRPQPDFIGLRNKEIVFNIEMKTGSSDISSMSAFQLDVSDCNDIIGFMARDEYKVPTFIFHVQVVEDYMPPTTRNVALNAWWASVYKLENAYLKSNMRRLERRQAVYYSTTAFKPFDEFLLFIFSERFEEEKEIAKKSLPKLYR